MNTTHTPPPVVARTSARLAAEHAAGKHTLSRPWVCLACTREGR